MPGRESSMRPKPDHGEESYRGCGKLAGLAAVITGGDSGIGRAVAIAFAREGADIAIGYLSEKEERDAGETRQLIAVLDRSARRRSYGVQDLVTDDGAARMSFSVPSFVSATSRLITLTFRAWPP